MKLPAFAVFLFVLSGCAAMSSHHDASRASATSYQPIYQAMPPKDSFKKPVPQLKEIAYMSGTWRCHVHAFAVGSAPARDFGEKTYVGKFIMHNPLNGEQPWLQIEDEDHRDLSFISYDPLAERWVVTGIEWPVTYGAQTGKMEGNKLVVAGKVTVFGRDYLIRATYTKHSDDAFTIFNEEQLPNGSWLPDDEYDFVRVKE